MVAFRKKHVFEIYKIAKIVKHNKNVSFPYKDISKMFIKKNGSSITYLKLFKLCSVDREY